MEREAFRTRFLLGDLKLGYILMGRDHHTFDRIHYNGNLILACNGAANKGGLRSSSADRIVLDVINSSGAYMQDKSVKAPMKFVYASHYR